MGGLKERKIVSQQIVAQNEFRITGERFELLSVWRLSSPPFPSFQRPARLRLAPMCLILPDLVVSRSSIKGAGQQSG